MDKMIISDVLITFTNTVISFLPNTIGALLLLLIGWLIGLVAGRVLKELLRRLKVDEYLARGKKPVFRLSNIFPVIATWSIYLVFIQASVDTLGIVALSTFLQGILAFIPGLIKAIIVIIVGYALAEYVRQNMEDSEVTYSKLIGSVLFFLIVYIAIATALPLVGIDPFLVNALLLVIATSVGVGLAIAIGFGLRDTVAEMVKKYKKKLQ